MKEDEVVWTRIHKNLNGCVCDLYCQASGRFFQKVTIIHAEPHLIFFDMEGSKQVYSGPYHCYDILEPMEDWE